MHHHPVPERRRASRGGVARGVLVVTGLAAAVALQLAGPRLQCVLASLVGIEGLAPSARPAEMAAPMPAHGVKVAQVVASVPCGRHPAS